MCVLLLDYSPESYLFSGISNCLTKIEYAQVLAKIAFTCQIRSQLYIILIFWNLTDKHLTTIKWVFHSSSHFHFVSFLLLRYFDFLLALKYFMRCLLRPSSMVHSIFSSKQSYSIIKLNTTPIILSFRVKNKLMNKK